jgi:nucleoside 2-deoxyribosyltransferase
MTKIYLAGGMKSGWQQTVINKYNNNEVTFINPQNHGLNKPELYTHWDLYGVKQCDILFGYMEEINPSGYGLAAEVGYAKAMGKLVILVDERSVVDDGFKYNYAFIHNIADVVFDNLDDGVDYLGTFIEKSSVTCMDWKV